MSSPEEIVLEVFLLVFVLCGFVMFVGCISSLIKKCYNKYVLKINSENDVMLSYYFGNMYETATATINAEPSIELTEVILSEPLNDDIINPIAIATEVLPYNV